MVHIKKKKKKKTETLGTEKVPAHRRVRRT